MGVYRGLQNTLDLAECALLLLVSGYFPLLLIMALQGAGKSTWAIPAKARYARVGQQRRRPF